MKQTVDFIGWSVVEVATVLLFLWVFLKKERLQIPCHSFFLPLLTLTLYSAATLFWSENFHATLTGTYKLIFIILSLVLFCNERELWEKEMDQTILILGSFASFWVLIGLPLPTSNHLLAGFIGVCALLSCARLFNSHRTAQSLILALFAAQLLSLFILGSLGAIVSFGTGLFFLFLLQKKNLRIFFTAFIFLILLSSLKPSTLGLEQIKNPLNTIWMRKKTDPFAFERAQIWKDSFAYFKSYPIRGSGLGTYRDVIPEFKKIPGLRHPPYAHNEVLNIFCELGITGAGILLWLTWNLFTALKRKREELAPYARWISVAIASITHSFFDFNLRYPPTLVVFIFSISLLLPTREITSKAAIRRISISVLMLGCSLLFALPGAAELIFKRYHTDPEKRGEAIAWAMRLDPFFSFYHSQTGRMRDLLIAIELEPRNVWYRRTAAEFYLRQWKDTREEKYLKNALLEYERILQLAPNVLQFKEEALKIKLLAGLTPQPEEKKMIQDSRFKIFNLQSSNFD